MNKNILHYSPEARQDLDDIWEYIAFELKNVSAANRIINNILNTIDNLTDFAKIGTQLAESNFRFLVSGKYMIFYHLDGQNVYIDRVMHGQRNYLKILFDN